MHVNYVTLPGTRQLLKNTNVTVSQDDCQGYLILSFQNQPLATLPSTLEFCLKYSDL